MPEFLHVGLGATGSEYRSRGTRDGPYENRGSYMLSSAPEKKSPVAWTRIRRVGTAHQPLGLGWWRRPPYEDWMARVPDSDRACQPGTRTRGPSPKPNH